MNIYEENEHIVLINKKTNKLEFVGRIKVAVKFIKEKVNTNEVNIRTSISRVRDKANRTAYGYYIRAQNSK